jgi:hypothetical protein
MKTVIRPDNILYGKIIKFTQEQPMKAGGLEVDSYLYSFFNRGARLGWVVNAMPRPLYPRERPGTHYIGGWVDSRAGLDT